MQASSLSICLERSPPMTGTPVDDGLSLPELQTSNGQHARVASDTHRDCVRAISSSSSVQL